MVMKGIQGLWSILRSLSDITLIISIDKSTLSTQRAIAKNDVRHDDACDVTRPLRVLLLSRDQREPGPPWQKSRCYVEQVLCARVQECTVGHDVS